MTSAGPGSSVSVSVLIPVSAVSPDVGAVHEDVVKELEGAGRDYEILYLVGAFSGASTLERVRGLHASGGSRVRVVEFAQNLGEAAMLRAGAERARADVLVTVPAHFESRLSAIHDLLRALDEGADLAFASRGRDGGPARFQSHLFNRITSWLTGADFHDVASGLRALRREVIDEIALYGDFHRYLPLLAQQAGFPVREIPAERDPRARSPVLHSPQIYLWRGTDILSLLFVSRFTRQPLRLFGGMGTLFAIFGLGILTWVGLDRLLAGTALRDRPMLVLGILMVGLGVQAFTIGLLGELLLFFRARAVRDYRVGAIYESEPPPLPERERAP